MRNAGCHLSFFMGPPAPSCMEGSLIWHACVQGCGTGKVRGFPQEGGRKGDQRACQGQPTPCLSHQRVRACVPALRMLKSCPHGRFACMAVFGNKAVKLSKRMQSDVPA